jgi:AcrR family transcriptional regulator
LILTSTRDILETDGLKALSAREIAKKIGYSAGTLYNVFENLDDLLLTVQALTLEDAVKALNGVEKNGDARRHVEDLAQCYIAFAISNRRLWNLLFQHHLPLEKSVPKSIDDGFDAAVLAFSEALSPLMAGQSTAMIEQRARALWTGVHGISAVVVSDKTRPVSPETAKGYVHSFVDGLLCSLDNPSRR